MHKAAIAGTGVFTPADIITNAELVAAYNAYAERQNHLHAAANAAGERAPMPMSSEEFIVRASGIEQRHVVDKAGYSTPRDASHPARARQTRSFR